MSATESIRELLANAQMAFDTDEPADLEECSRFLEELDGAVRRVRAEVTDAIANDPARIAARKAKVDAARQAMKTAGMPDEAIERAIAETFA